MKLLLKLTDGNFVSIRIKHFNPATYMRLSFSQGIIRINNCRFERYTSKSIRLRSKVGDDGISIGSDGTWGDRAKRRHHLHL